MGGLGVSFPETKKFSSGGVGFLFEGLYSCGSSVMRVTAVIASVLPDAALLVRPTVAGEIAHCCANPERCAGLESLRILVLLQGASGTGKIDASCSRNSPPLSRFR